MKVTDVHVDLSKNYITEPLNKEALSGVIKGGKFQTAHQLYLVVNGVKERYYFQELDDHDKYSISAAINVRYTYAGEARKQVEAISMLRPLLKNKHIYEVIYKVFLKEGMQEVYNFKHLTKSKQEVYDLIIRLREKTLKICNQNML